MYGVQAFAYREDSISQRFLSPPSAWQYICRPAGVGNLRGQRIIPPNLEVAMLSQMSSLLRGVSAHEQLYHRKMTQEVERGMASQQRLFIVLLTESGFTSISHSQMLQTL
jgi:hypothetical protein